MNKQMIFVRRATVSDIKYVNEIIKEIEESAVARGTGIAKRTPESIAQKMRDDKAVIALTSVGQWVGFSYFESWEQGKYVSNSGLIVAPLFRHTGVAKSIKDRIFKISRRMYPHAKIFSITSGTAVMKMNTQLGFQPVAFSEITHDEQFWEGCKGCPNYDILERKHKCNCLCTAMLFDPAISTEHSILPGHELEQRYSVQNVNSI
jgi:N-acetylglutamate synthase-like GNAT family acetyltransferase